MSGLGGWSAGFSRRVFKEAGRLAQYCPLGSMGWRLWSRAECPDHWWRGHSARRHSSRCRAEEAYVESSGCLVHLAMNRESTVAGVFTFLTALTRRLKPALHVVLAFAVFLLGIGAIHAASPTRDLGIEGDATFELPRADYQARPLDDRTELILRIEAITPVAADRHRYDFHYMGLEPGSYSLADYLMRPDGSRPDELAELRVQVESRLPLDHSGQLSAYVPGRFPFLGGYRAFLIFLGVLWLFGIGAFIWSYRKKVVRITPVAVVPEPTFAERLRPLVAAAATGEISLDERTLLERLVMGFWREELALPELRMAEALARLKQHPQAGALLRALERWLHQRGGGSIDEVNSLLEIYRQPDLPPTPEGGTS